VGEQSASKTPAPAKPGVAPARQRRPAVAGPVAGNAGPAATPSADGRHGQPRPNPARAADHAFAGLRVHASDDAAAADRGTPLPAPVRASLESRFGRSLGRVRVHAGAEADRIARGQGALAVNEGDRLYFADGVYAPGTPQGGRVLRHELAHYLQRRNPGTAWPTSLLEAEADDVAARESGPLPVRGRAAGAPPLAMKTYVSTVGGNPYLDIAVKFYKLWENETATRIGSYQAIVDDLAKEKTALGDFRIVAHANGNSLFLPLMAAGKAYADLGFLELQTEQAVALKYSELGHITSDMTGQVQRWLKKTEPGKSLLPKLKMDTDLGGLVKDWVWWVVDEHFAAHAKEDKPQKKEKASTAKEIADLKAEVTKAQSAIKSALVASLPKGVGAADMDALRTATLDAFKAQAWDWGTVGAGELKGRLDRLTDPDRSSLRKALEAGTFETNLKAVKARVSDKTKIEIRGCNIGSNDDYLNGIRAFFGTRDPTGKKTDRLPAISAPMMYQYFGNPGALIVPEGKKQPPVADSLKFLFEETFEKTSDAKDVLKAVKDARLTSMTGLVKVLQHADIRAQFQDWWTMKQKARGVADKDLKSATLKDFQDFLTSKPPGTFPVNAPGTGSTSLWFLVLAPATAIDTLLAWVKAQGYSLPGKADMKKEFFKDDSSWDPGRMAKGQDAILVDWLGDTYPVPDNIIFPEDPKYQANIRRLP
jgi:hypothetical protein